MLPAIPSDECFVMFNARVGSRDSGGMKGVHMGMGISMMLVESYFLFFNQ